ncbi:MAG: hypothetical protein V4627_20910 [Pseudomonadota bacterium]
MRYLIASIFCLVLVSPQVHACPGFLAESTIFFVTIPNPLPNADVIAKVSLLEVNSGTATAKVLQLQMTSGVKIQQGDKIALQYKFNSCGPHHKSGDEGIIIARAVADSKGDLVLHPFSHQRADDYK